MSNISGTMHLKIMKGIAKTPKDTNSSEQGLDEINLLDLSGFTCDEYLIKLPNIKSSAVYADSPIADGRTLISGSLANVVETIRLTLNGSSIIQTSAMLSKLGRFKQDCNDFWDTFSQIEPVYIKHQVDGEPGPRYALLYNIDIDIETPIDPSTPMRTITLSIEREYGWRGIAPGDNPKRWTYYKLGQSYNNSSAALNSGTDHIVKQVIQNRREWNAAQTSLISQNHIDIPAASIPGDMDALCIFHAEIGTIGAIQSGRAYVGRKSIPDAVNNNGVIRPPNYILSAAESSAGTDTTFEADTGAPISGAAATSQRSKTTFATATNVMRLQYTASTRGYFDPTTLRGRWIIFARARLSAAGTVTMNLKYTAAGGPSISYPTATLTDVGAGGTGNTTAWALVYLGVCTFPMGDPRVFISSDGLGIYAPTSGSFALELFAARTLGTPNLYVADLVLIPIDECVGMVDYGVNLTGYTIDSTGYYSHGATGGLGLSIDETVELRGNAITLKPGVNNRLIYLMATPTPQSEIAPTLTVYLNIVPRWSGLRDA